MAEDYGDYLPYEEESGWKKRFELTIPILLLILVLFVLAWRLDWLAGVPIIGNILGGSKVANILIVGQDNNIIRVLDQVRPDLTVNYEVLASDEIDDIRDAAYLRDYDIIIITEYAGGNFPDDRANLPSIFRSYLSEYLESSGKLILIGLAGSRDPAEPTSNGWVQWEMDRFIPAECRTGLCDSINSVDVEPTDLTSLKIRKLEHSVLKEFGPTAAFSSGDTIEFALVNCVGGEKLMDIEVSGGSTPLAHCALAEESFGLGGKTIYFSYDPSRTPTVFKNVLAYLRG
jgi:hypothetical protein